MRIRLSPVAVVFLALAVFSAVGAATDIGRLASHGGSGRALVAGYAIVRAAVAVVFAAFVVMRGPARRRVRAPGALLACAVAMGALVVTQAPKATDVGAVTLVGELLVLVGFSWLLIAASVLGRCFGVLPEARGLVVRGPYRLVRHPIYLGELTAALGLLIAAPTLLNGLLAAAFLVAQVVRMGMEERELASNFPAYAEYARRTPRLIPRLRQPSTQIISLEY